MRCRVCLFAGFHGRSEQFLPLRFGQFRCHYSQQHAGEVVVLARRKKLYEFPAAADHVVERFDARIEPDSPAFAVRDKAVLFRLGLSEIHSYVEAGASRSLVPADLAVDILRKCGRCPRQHYSRQQGSRQHYFRLHYSRVILKPVPAPSRKESSKDMPAQLSPG